MSPLRGCRGEVQNAKKMGKCKFNDKWMEEDVRGRGIFADMFPDSQLAKSFTCGENKTAYVAKYGIASFTKKELSCSVSEKPYVVMFDESSWVTPELRTCWVISM